MTPRKAEPVPGALTDQSLTHPVQVMILVFDCAAARFYAFASQKVGGELCNALLLLVLQYSFPALWPPRRKRRHPALRVLRKRTTITVSGRKVCSPRSLPSRTPAR